MTGNSPQTDDHEERDPQETESDADRRELDQRSLTIERRTEILEAYYSGPLPPPSLLRDYDEIVPGSADRIITLAEKQSNHRRELEAARIHADIGMSKTGMWLGFVLALVFIVGAFVLIALGHTLEGFAAAAVPIAAIVGSYLFTRRDKQQQLEERRQEAERLREKHPDQDE